MKARAVLFLSIGVLVLAIGLAIAYVDQSRSRKVTFRQCENAGGVAWAVNLHHPDICAVCAEVRACEDEHRGSADVREACPQAVACSTCMEANFPYPKTCPDGREKVGEISDAAIWFLCCR